MIPRTKISELEKKLRAIEDHPEFSKEVREEQRRFMITEANFHSFMMEVTEGTSSFADENVVERFGTFEDIKHNTQQIWDWAIDNYPGWVDHDFIKGIAARFEPKLNSFGYRRDNVRLKGFNYIPPRWEKVPDRMHMVVDGIAGLSHPIEQAIYAHLNIARVQPFLDGNKRTARLVQNVVLHQANFPPILIYGGEKDDYLHHFEDACEGHKKMETSNDNEYISEGERRFYRYLLGKEAASLESLYSHLCDRRNYRVDVQYKERGCMFTLKRVLKSYFDKSNKKASVRIQGNVLDVRGDVSQAKLSELLETNNGYKKLDIEVVR